METLESHRFISNKDIKYSHPFTSVTFPAEFVLHWPEKTNGYWAGFSRILHQLGTASSCHEIVINNQPLTHSNSRDYQTRASTAIGTRRLTFPSNFSSHSSASIFFLLLLFKDSKIIRASATLRSDVNRQNAVERRGSCEAQQKGGPLGDCPCGYSLYHAV